MSAPVIDEPEKFAFPALVKIVCLALLGLGLVTFGLSFLGGPALAFSGWAIAAWYVLGLPLFAMFFLCINHLSSAGWHVTMKRVPEAFTRWFPVGLVTIGILTLSFLFSTEGDQLYEWVHFHDHGDLHSELIEGKRPWLNPSAFFIRTGIYFGLWILFAWLIVGASRKQDVDGDVKHTFRAKHLSAPFCIIFGLSVTFASMDYVMSVEPAWFSTMFGVYHFAGIVESGFAMLILMLLLLQRLGYYKTAVNENHLHNLGIWLLSAATFWAYIWFCQFMLIWYANIPEETAHFFARWESPWMWVTWVINPLLNWALVFLILLPRPNKRNRKLLAIAACIALLGRFVDIWQFMSPRPHANEAGIPEAHYMPWHTFWQVLIVVGLLAGFVFVVLKALEKAPLLAKKDPYFEESVHHHL
jgi:hypothetical protein